MPLPPSEQEAIQQTVERASKQEKDALKSESETTLWIMKSKANEVFTKEEMKEIEIAIETLVRIEATEQNKGWWFRAKRRVELTHKVCY